MGLALEVGILSDLKINDDEGYAIYKAEFEKLNRLLKSEKLDPHKEPEDIEEREIFSCEMLGYTGLHHLRRYAAHLALAKPEPKPINYDDSDDPIIDEYGKLAISQDPDALLELFSKTQTDHLQYQHLILHSDADGFYIPQNFEEVIFSSEDIEVMGGMVGSVHQLYDECTQLADHLEIPMELDHEAEEVFEAAGSPQTEGEKWKRYGIETFHCLRLIRACEASLEKNAAIVFC
jgi:hypothetical protein